MSKHAIEGCPRCGRLFTCKLNASLKCDCMNVALTPNEMQYIRDISVMEHDGSCLCMHCLEELRQETQG